RSSETAQPSTSSTTVVGTSGARVLIAMPENLLIVPKGWRRGRVRAHPPPPPRRGAAVSDDMPVHSALDRESPHPLHRGDGVPRLADVEGSRTWPQGAHALAPRQTHRCPPHGRP